MSEPLEPESAAGPLFGLTLIEVFSVTVKLAENGSKCKPYGAIYIEPGFIFNELPAFIYYRKKDDCESIDTCESKSDCQITLTGPNRTIYPCSNFFIKVVLYHRDDSDSESYDKEIAYGRFYWNEFATDNVYDTPVTAEISGEHGVSTINYVLFSEAISAELQLLFFSTDGENAQNFRGTVTASTNRIAGHEIVLLDSSRSGPVTLRNENLVSLLRSVVAVPLRSELTIKACLHYSNDLLGEKPFASFPVQCPGFTSEEYIQWRGGKFRVIIKWAKF